MIETRAHLRLRQMRSHRERAVDQVGVAKLIESTNPQTGKIEKKEPHWLQSQNAYINLLQPPLPMNSMLC